MATITDIADAVVAEINGHTWVAAPPTPPEEEGGDPTPAFTAQRHYRPRFDLKDMAALHVSVVPKGVTVDRLDRTRNQEDYQIDVAVQKKFERGDAAELDPLMGLVQEVRDFFRLRRLAEYPDALWVRTENVPVYAVEHLDELRQFTSVLTLTFRVVR
jgi:hypothetical protein